MMKRMLLEIWTGTAVLVRSQMDEWDSYWKPRKAVL